LPGPSAQTGFRRGFDRGSMVNLYSTFPRTLTARPFFIAGSKLMSLAALIAWSVKPSGRDRINLMSPTLASLRKTTLRITVPLTPLFRAAAVYSGRGICRNRGAEVTSDISTRFLSPG